MCPYNAARLIGEHSGIIHISKPGNYLYLYDLKSVGTGIVIELLSFIRHIFKVFKNLSDIPYDFIGNFMCSI